MDVLLKKYFWLIDLVVVGLCAGLGGRATSHLIEQAPWLLGDEQPAATAPRLSATPFAEKAHTKDAERVIERDVFCSTCKPPPPPDANKGEEGVSSNEPVKTTLPLELVSTQYVPDDPKWSMAVIRDTSTKEKDAMLYNAGKILPGGGRILRIDPKRVYLLNANHVEYMEIEGTEKKDKPPGEPVTVASLGNGADPLDSLVAKGVHCSGSNCEIERAVVDAHLSNTTALATAARFVPSVKDGRPNGFKLYAIRPTSIFGKIGLQNGDTVKSINGMEMSSPDQALGVYTKLRSASHLTVSVERRGETVTLDYTIR